MVPYLSLTILFYLTSKQKTNKNNKQPTYTSKKRTKISKMSTDQKVLRIEKIAEFAHKEINRKEIRKSIIDKKQAKPIMIETGNKIRDAFIKETGIKNWKYDQISGFMNSEDFVAKAAESFATAQVYLWCASKLLKTERNRKSAEVKKLSTQQTIINMAAHIKALEEKVAVSESKEKRKREDSIVTIEPKNPLKKSKNNNHN